MLTFALDEVRYTYNWLIKNQDQPLLISLRYLTKNTQIVNELDI